MTELNSRDQPEKQRCPQFMTLVYKMQNTTYNALVTP